VTHRPIPFFGNPATAVAATVGVNPSSGEFQPNRNWNTVQNAADWKRRLKNDFNHSTPPYDWFAPWRTGLALLDLDYENGSAAHFDVSYRPTKAMPKNRATFDPAKNGDETRPQFSPRFQAASHQKTFKFPNKIGLFPRYCPPISTPFPRFQTYTQRFGNGSPNRV
jgi:hypothetical protein